MNVNRISETPADQMTMLVASHLRADMRLPPNLGGDLIDEVDPPRVPEIAQPVSDRVDTGLGRKFVDIRIHEQKCSATRRRL